MSDLGDRNLDFQPKTWEEHGRPSVGVWQGYATGGPPPSTPLVGEVCLLSCPEDDNFVRLVFAGGQGIFIEQTTPFRLQPAGIVLQELVEAERSQEKVAAGSGRSPRRVGFGAADLVDELAGYWSSDALEELSAMLEKAAVRKRRRRKSGGKAARRRRKDSARLLEELAGLIGAAQVKAAASENSPGPVCSLRALAKVGGFYQVYDSYGGLVEVTLSDGTVTTEVPPDADFSVPFGVDGVRQVFLYRNGLKLNGVIS